MFHISDKSADECKENNSSTAGTRLALANTNIMWALFKHIEFKICFKKISKENGVIKENRKCLEFFLGINTLGYKLLDLLFLLCSF